MKEEKRILVVLIALVIIAWLAILSFAVFVANVEIMEHIEVSEGVFELQRLDKTQEWIVKGITIATCVICCSLLGSTFFDMTVSLQDIKELEKQKAYEEGRRKAREEAAIRREQLRRFKNVLEKTEEMYVSALNNNKEAKK